MGQGNPKSEITLDTADSFFFELVHGAVRNQNIKVQPETEFYIVKLLNRFIFSESLYSRNREGALEEQPLAFMMKEALEAEVSAEQKSLFQNVGDISLYKAGFFQERITRSLVDLDYYIGIGGAAYQNAAHRTDEKSYRSLFLELSDKFPNFVNILGEISEKTTFTKSEQDLFRLYDMWSRTKSDRAAKALKKAGIKVDGSSDDSDS
ncbi:MAG: hypothetical protein JST80_07925 [Bdellovibrionales bacterium]|nr:hypothetical protein [Bdellovibrionales bacterium]